MVLDSGVYDRIYDFLASLRKNVKKLVLKIQGESWEGVRLPQGYYVLKDLGITLMVRRTIASSGVTLIDVEGGGGAFCGEIVIHRAKDGTTLAYHKYTK